MGTAGEPAEISFLTGRQSLYGETVLEHVAEQSRDLCQAVATGLWNNPRVGVEAGAHDRRRDSPDLAR